MDQKISFDLFKDIQPGYLTDISMHTLLDMWTRYHDKILLESARLSIETLADSHIVTLIVTVTLRVAH